MATGRYLRFLADFFFLLALFFFELFFGTFLPAALASDRPIAIACLRLFTLPPRPPGPLRAEPLLYSRISFSTYLPALDEYFRFDFLFFAISDLRLALRCLTRRSAFNEDEARKIAV